MAGSAPTSPRSRSAESAAVRKTRELPRLSTGGFGGDSFWDPACHGLLSRGWACGLILLVTDLVFAQSMGLCPPILGGNHSLFRENAALHRVLQYRAHISRNPPRCCLGSFFR